MHVDILTTFDQQTGHKRSFVLSTADGSTLRQTVMIPDGIGAFSMIMLRLIETEDSTTVSVATSKSVEQVGVPQRLGTIDIDDDDFARLDHFH
jgi:hypothetical protein